MTIDARPENRIMMRDLVHGLGVPYADVTMALCNLRYVQVRNCRLYDRAEALAALAAFYDRRAEDNRRRWKETGKDIFRQRLATSLARRSLVDKAMEEMES